MMIKKDQFLRRFYEPLVLLRVLDPTREAIKPDLVSDRGLNEQAKLWRDFLDHLSFLCDSVKGGDTVTAIATQKTFEHTVFWLASNSSSRTSAQDHLQWMLSTIRRLYENSSTESEVEDKLFRGCIDFGSKRISTYVKWLQKVIEEARSLKEGLMTAEDDRLFRSLEAFGTDIDNHHTLCTLAHRSRYEEIMTIISKRHNAQDQRNVWSEIRHLLGRLGLWTKAVKILIRAAQRFPQYIENARVEVIEPKGRVDIPNVEHLTDFAGLVNRMLSKNESATAETLNQAIKDLDSLHQIRKSFCEAYRDISPRPHAELLALEHFYYHDFEFVHNDRYIGCSKPSCYCCYLYMQCHPGQFSPRPCHGNLWINWAPPIPLTLMVSPRAHERAPLRVQEHHSFQILQKMLGTIRRDLQEQVISKRPKRNRQPDSSSGLSSVLNRLHQFNQDGHGGEVQTIITPSNFLTNLAHLQAYPSEPSAAPTPVANDRKQQVSDGSDEGQVADLYETELAVDTSDDSGPQVHSQQSLIVNSENDEKEDYEEEDEDEDEDTVVFKGRMFRTTQTIRR